MKKAYAARGVKKAYAVRFGIEMAYFLVSKKPLLKTASDMYKDALKLYPKWLVKIIVGYDVD